MSDQTPPPPSPPPSSSNGDRKRPHESDLAAVAEVIVDNSEEAAANAAEEDELINMDELFGDQDALYGAASDTECTYSRGYLPRQPVFACRTCATDGPAAICYGCARHCHEGHDLLELYSKRNLCCDCGNAKFANVLEPSTGEKFACQLCEFKTLNRENRYNHNFDGLYCVCDRPYPDPDCSTSEEMVQCAVCEDWYHFGHLHLGDGHSGAAGLTSDCYEELVCQLCSARLPYLRHYALPSDTSAKPSDTSAKPSDTLVQQSDTSAKPSDTLVHQSDTSAKPSDTLVQQSDTSAKPSDTLAKPSDTLVQQSDTSAKPSDTSVNLSDAATKPSDTFSVNRCYLAELCRGNDGDAASSSSSAALLMPAGWRRRLCRCARCLAAYAADDVAFLTEPADSLAEFEQANRRSAEEQSRPENVLASLAGAGLPHASVQLVAGAIGDFQRGLARAMASVLADKNCGEGQPAVITRQDADRILAMMAPLMAKRARFQPPDTCRKD